MATTAKTAAPIFGDKLYQIRARAALPILVRQAGAGTPILYSALALELGMANPRNLNYVLGCIGQTIELYKKKWKEAVPPIQCLVVNKATGLPGEGIGWFLVKKEDYADLPLKRQREIVSAELQHVYAYPRWRDLLVELNLDEVPADFEKKLKTAAAFGGGGESSEHAQLKRYVANHPEVVGLPDSSSKGREEERLPSGDCLDVSFRTGKVWVGVEVKSAISSEPDLVRGIFQCVKYRAVLEAVLVSESKLPNARSVLVVGSPLPVELVALSNLLGVEVVVCSKAG